MKISSASQKLLVHYLTLSPFVIAKRFGSRIWLCLCPTICMHSFPFRMTRRYEM